MNAVLTAKEYAGFEAFMARMQQESAGGAQAGSRGAGADEAQAAVLHDHDDSDGESDDVYIRL